MQMARGGIPVWKCAFCVGGLDSRWIDASEFLFGLLSWIIGLLVWSQSGVEIGAEGVGVGVLEEGCLAA